MAECRCHRSSSPFDYGSTIANSGRKRSYRSPRRDEQARLTRHRIVTSATQHFSRDGYAATSLKAIARTAGVSVPAVELAYRTKGHLLAAAIDIAIAGDDAAQPMLERADTVALAAQEDPRRFLRATSRIVEQIQARSAGLILAARDAARRDDEIAELMSAIDERRMTIARWLADEVRRRQGGRSNAHRTMTTYLLLDPAVYQQLRTAGDSDYPTWLAGALHAILR